VGGIAKPACNLQRCGASEICVAGNVPSSYHVSLHGEASAHPTRLLIMWRLLPVQDAKAFAALLAAVLPHKRGQFAFPARWDDPFIHRRLHCASATWTLGSLVVFG